MKRLLDFVLSGIFLLLLLVPMAIIALFVLIFVGRPILFRQLRPGRDGVIFRLHKFRTMSEAHDEQGKLLPDAQRLKRFGVFLRSTSLDELPSLWNVLVGEMSLVGPRPLLPEYLPLYSSEQSRRHDVRPGITGWAQINGRNNLTWNEKFKLDVWYVDNCSMMLDLKIMLLTIARVVLRDDVSQDGQVTMKKFTGNSS